MGTVDPDVRLVKKLVDSVTDFDARTGPEAYVTDFDAFICSDSPFIDSDAHIDVDAAVIDHDRDLKTIVDGLLYSPPSASLGRFPTSRPLRQVRPKLADVIFEQRSNKNGCRGRQPR